MKKVLVFIDWYKPGYKAGGPIRSVANMVDHLKAKYEFYILTRNSDYMETLPYPDIEANKWIESAENEFVYYISNEKLSISNIWKIIQSTAFNIVYINGVYSFYFSILPLILLKKIKDRKIIVAPRGMLSAQTFKAKVIKKRLFILFTRLLGMYKKTIFHTTSEDEKTDIQNLKFNPAAIYQISNLATRIRIQKLKLTDKQPGKLRLISIARISNEKNTLFALQCLQNFNYQGSIVFDLYGSIYQKEYWNECKEVISKLPASIEVNYAGEINNNEVLDILQHYHFLYMPSLGENFGHSILESFTSGCPVLISNKTPWQNLKERGLGWDLDLNQPESFAHAIQQALDMNNETYAQLSENCHQFASNYVDNQEIKKEYEKLFG